MLTYPWVNIGIIYFVCNFSGSTSSFLSAHRVTTAHTHVIHVDKIVLSDCWNIISVTSKLVWHSLYYLTYMQDQLKHGWCEKKSWKNYWAAGWCFG